MNDFFEKYYTGKKFPTNRKNPFINGTRSKYIFDDRNNIYMSYQPIFYTSTNYYTGIYENNIYISSNFNYDDYEYYINNNSVQNNRMHSITYNNTQKQIYNHNSFKNTSNNKIYNSFNHNYFDNDILYNRINYNNYNTNTFNTFTKFNRSCDLKNNFHSTDFTQNYIPEFNSNLIDLEINKNSKINHLSDIPSDFNKSIPKIYETNKNNKNILYINHSLDATNYNKETKNKKIMKINILNGKAYIQNNKNDNNNMFYISDPNKKKKNIQYEQKTYNIPKIEKKKMKIIKLNYGINGFNNQKKIFKTRSINLKNVPKVFINFDNNSKNNNEPKQKAYNDIINNSQTINKNINSTTESKLITENKSFKDNNEIKKNIPVKKINLPENNIKINKTLQKIKKPDNFQKKKINLNLHKKNFSAINSHKSFNKDSRLIPKLSSSNSKKIIRRNIKHKITTEKEEKNKFKIPIPNNTILVSINTCKNKNGTQNQDNKERTISEIPRSFLTNKTEKNKKDNLFGILKAKKECELCHVMVYSHLYKIHHMSHPTQIFKYLYLGNFNQACNIQELKKLKINYILNCASDCYNYNLPKSVKELHLLVKDLEDFDIIKFFEKGNEFINKCKLMGGTCLVHCKLGISRSATFVIAYLIKHEKLTADEAFDFVKKKRISIRPNNGFMKQLHIYEKIVREK